MHLLAESYENMKKAMGPPEEVEEMYPWAMVLAGAGFMLTLIPAQLMEPSTDERRCLDCDSSCEYSRDLPFRPGAAIVSRGLSLCP